MDVPFKFLGKEVKGQGHNALITENGNWPIIAFSLLISSWNFTHKHSISSGYACMILLLKT